MARIALFVLGLGLLAWLAMRGMESGLLSRGGSGGQEPTRQLDNVRQSADRIEQEQQQRVDRVLEKTREGGEAP